MSRCRCPSATTPRPKRLIAKSGSVGAAEPPAAIAEAVALIQDYCAGGRVDFSGVPIDLSAIDEPRQRIYQAMRALRFGETTTYGDLAKITGATDWEGARDVGIAMGRNPMPIVVPCHRVLAAGGRLGGFSAYGGAKTKEKLLALEGVRLNVPRDSAPRQEPPRLPGL